MKKYSSCTVQYHVQFQGMTESCFYIKVLNKQWKKRDIVTHFAMKIICTYLYITCNKKILFVKKYQLISGGIGMNHHTHTHTHTIYTCTHTQLYVYATPFLCICIISEAGHLLAAGPSCVTHWHHFAVPTCTCTCCLSVYEVVVYGR